MPERPRIQTRVDPDEQDIQAVGDDVGDPPALRRGDLLPPGPPGNGRHLRPRGAGRGPRARCAVPAPRPPRPPTPPPPAATRPPFPRTAPFMGAPRGGARPAVSTMSTSLPRARAACTASKATEPGSPPRCPATRWAPE